MVKILVIGDLHGRKPVIKEKDFDCIISVGDVCDDREIGKYYKKLFKMAKKSDEKLDINEMIVNDVGKKEFERMIKRSIKKGNEILKYLDSFGKPVFIVGGNWDESYGPSRIKDINKNDYNYLKAFYDWFLGDKLNEDIVKGTKNIKNCMFHLHKFKGINFFGYGLSSCPEKKSKSKKKPKGKVNLTNEEIKKLKKAYKKIQLKLENTYKKRDESNMDIFISHNIPNKTKLDKIKQKGSYAQGKHMGSTIAREIINKHHPKICIGGHIHEGKGKQKLGKTKVLNPGYGRKAQILIEIDENKKKIKKIKFLGKEK